MALTKCNAAVAANVAPDCTTPAVAGLGDAGVGYHFEDVTFTRDVTNPRKITAITVADGKKGFAVYNQDAIPFADSGVEMNTEGSVVSFNKTINIKIPQFNADGSMNAVEPLAKSRNGFVFVFPTKQKTADGGFVIIGDQKGAKASTGARNYTEDAQNGAFAMSLVESNSPFETVCLTGATFDDAQTTFDALLAAVI